MGVSTFTWLDHREEDANRVREAIAAFDQPGTLDPLGFGVVRDTFSDLLFPGISTVQTRARYFLLVPWAYQRLDTERPNPSKALKRVREIEAEQIVALLAGSETKEGIIGQSTGAATVQMPSFIYWGGLDTFGIRRTEGTRAEIAMSARERVRNHRPSPWHHSLPAPPDDLYGHTSLALTPDESTFLADRILDSVSDTYLAHLVRTAGLGDGAADAWDHPARHTAPDPVQRQLHHAQRYAYAVHGAGLLYNLELSRLLESETGQPLPTDYDSQFDDWLLATDDIDFADWDLTEFWAIVTRTNPTIGSQHRLFIGAWLEGISRGPRNLDTRKAVRELTVREMKIKKARAKLAYKSARERYPTAQGDTRLAFRWKQVQDIVTDILEGRNA